MKRSGRRGAGLVTVLLVSALVVVVCLSLASLCVLNLNLSTSFATSTQTLLLAQAAVEQFLSEADMVDDVSESSETDHPDWRRRFEVSPVFPTHASRLDGDVRITFDPREPWYSVDNSDSGNAAAGWFDRHTSRKSVPPFSVDLVLTVTRGGVTRHYEALLRRRWPYALCTPGQVTLMGAPHVSHWGAEDGGAWEPSHLIGSIFRLDHAFEFRLPPLFPASGTVGKGGRNPAEGDVIEVPLELGERLKRCRIFSDEPIKVGGTFHFYPDPLVKPHDFLLLNSVGNSIKGPIDLMARDETRLVYVARNNIHEGDIRYGVELTKGFEKRLRRAFSFPDVREWRVVQPQDAAFLNSQHFYFLKDPLRLPHEADAGGGRGDGVDYPPHRRFLINYSMGNRRVLPGGGVVVSGAGLELDNCVLLVNGDLDLSHWRPGMGKSLAGRNATLIVNGTLYLSNGALEASDEGMVIIARRLISRASGTYRGLIFVERTATFFPTTTITGSEGPRATPPRLTIEGAIVCGGTGTHVDIVDDTVDPPHKVDAVALTGVHLWSTTLRYDARFLKALHRHGPLRLMALKAFP